VGGKVDPLPSAVRLTRVSRRFGDVRALDDVSLDVREGEFFSLLGPSGSGKTTCLRLVAGFDEPTSGTIELLGKNVVGIPPYERDVNTVFQDYALFPHMDVGENVAYGLRVKKAPRDEAAARVAQALALVRLPGLSARRPGQLSGGQRQRVALARALVNRPRVLLLDEPLGALDLKLRQQMQVELRVLQRQLGITFVYVTHDQEEALSMSDRLAVFLDGRVEQVGTPAEVYEDPRTAFVAGFVGTSNRLDGALAREATGMDGELLLRPEKIRLLPPGESAGRDECAASGVVEDATYLGPFTRYRVRADVGGELVVLEQNRAAGRGEAEAAPGRRVVLAWAREHNRRVESDR
jgi:putative spermidine/putrescine transport system ATP-binding protein